MVLTALCRGQEDKLPSHHDYPAQQSQTTLGCKHRKYLNFFYLTNVANSNREFHKQQYFVSKSVSALIFNRPGVAGLFYKHLRN